MKLILLMAMTLDGKIARSDAHFPDWTGKADKRMFKQMTMGSGVIIMGSRTFSTIGKALPDRLNIVMTRHPERYQSVENLQFTSDPPEIILKKLSEQGYETAVLTGGAAINSLFAQKQLIDEMIITIIPKLFGQGISLFAQSMDQSVELIKSFEIEPGVIVLHYKIIKDGLDQGTS